MECIFPEFLAQLFPTIPAESDWNVPYRSLDNEPQHITGDADCFPGNNGQTTPRAYLMKIHVNRTMERIPHV